MKAADSATAMASSSLKDNPLFENAACPACGSNDLTHYFSTKYGNLKQKKSLDYSPLGIEADTVLSLDRCNSCGMVFTNPRIKPEHTHLVYNEAKTPQHKRTEAGRGSEGQRRDTFRRRLRYFPILLNMVAAWRGQGSPKVLDYGCGMGHSLSLAKGLGLEGVGVDVDEHRLGHCRDLGLRVHAPHELAAREPGWQADIILVQSVIEHIVDLDGFARQIKCMAAPGALLFVDGIRPSLIAKERRKGQFVKAHFIEHINYFPTRTLDLFWALHGFRPCPKITLHLDAKPIKAPQWLMEAYNRLWVNNGFFERFYQLDQ